MQKVILMRKLALSISIIILSLVLVGCAQEQIKLPPGVEPPQKDIAGQATHQSITRDQLAQGQGIYLDAGYNYVTWPSDLPTTDLLKAVESIKDTNLFVYTWDSATNTWHLWYNPSGPYGQYNGKYYPIPTVFKPGQLYYFYQQNADALKYAPGCMNPAAHNYVALATSDDGSCQTCTDTVKNGDETDVDCGGSKCTDCTQGKTCNAGADCATGLICDSVTKQCKTSGTPPSFTCSDGIKNGDENGVDCDGHCAGCVASTEPIASIFSSPESTGRTTYETVSGTRQLRSIQWISSPFSVTNAGGDEEKLNGLIVNVGHYPSSISRPWTSRVSGTDQEIFFEVIGKKFETTLLSDCQGIVFPQQPGFVNIGVDPTGFIGVSLAETEGEATYCLKTTSGLYAKLGGFTHQLTECPDALCTMGVRGSVKLGVWPR